MTTTVYYWPPHDNQVGHAAVGVRGAAGIAHISWWPRDEGKQDNSGRLRSVIYGVPGVRYSLEEDISGEGGRMPVPTLLDGLNEGAILTWWRGFALQDWSLLRINCAQVAVDALRAGGASDYVSGMDGWLSSWQASYWKPAEVHTFAQHVKAGLRNAATGA